MKIFVNILLGLCSAACAAALFLQGFMFPALPGWADVLLRIGMALFLQLLTLRICEKKLLRFAPLLISAAAAVWGFFLLLTSPSWRGATVGGYLHDYVSFFAAAATVCLLRWAKPWLRGKFRQLKKVIRRRKKKKMMKDIPHS